MPYFVFWVEYRRELRFPREGVSEAARDDNYFRSATKKRWEDEHPRYAFTQPKHDNYSLQIKGQMPADKDIFERHMKLQADSRRIRCARNSITIFIG